MHVAMIMDGNGRWATQRGLPRAAGHVEGARAVARIVECAVAQGIDVLTLYAFSTDNWDRPPAEVTALLRLFERYLQAELPNCVENSVHINIIGNRARLAPDLLHAINTAEQATRDGTRLQLRIAIDYSARDSLLTAAGRCRNIGQLSRAVFRRQLEAGMHCTLPAPDVDLLIRTGGEQRLSDFLLWECAYAELIFLDCLWPDFSPARLTECLHQFTRRERRFGRLLASTA
ncbi:MAG: polyprenyl diphosphate synthase [Gammaproteobacteria bacterium]|nr:polyprenyl diphosphate synthase [Gammaproteobacteria bacterium]